MSSTTAPDALLTTLLRNVLTSRVYQVIPTETALDVAPRLSRRLRNEVLVKREDLLPVFSFKLRGAYNKIAHLDDTERARGIRRRGAVATPARCGSGPDRHSTTTSGVAAS